MKKLLALFLALLFVFALSACGNNVNHKSFISNGANQQNQSDNSQASTVTATDSSNQNQQQGNQTTAITREKALEIVLEKAGVNQAEIHDLDIELDTERGVKIWEVDFEHGNLEYSYDVNAKTGAVTKVESEIDN